MRRGRQGGNTGYGLVTVMIFNFGGAFWNTLRNYRNSQAFDDLLAREDVTLALVLDDEDVVQELRNQNPKLLSL